jgi:hypothetical protein
MSGIYRILYCSRSVLDGSSEEAAEEIRKILAKSRVNNERDGITGALFFSQQAFAQVLEGPAEMVEAAFERIQCDERHSEAVILESGNIETRDFPSWSMAFAGETDVSGLGSAIISTAFSGQTSAGDSVLALLRGVIVREDEWLVSEVA